MSSFCDILLILQHALFVRSISIKLLQIDTKINILECKVPSTAPTKPWLNVKNVSVDCVISFEPKVLGKQAHSIINVVIIKFSSQVRSSMILSRIRQPGARGPGKKPWVRPH